MGIHVSIVAGTFWGKLIGQGRYGNSCMVPFFQENSAYVIDVIGHSVSILHIFGLERMATIRKIVKGNTVEDMVRDNRLGQGESLVFLLLGNTIETYAHALGYELRLVALEGPAIGELSARVGEKPAELPALSNEGKGRG